MSVSGGKQKLPKRKAYEKCWDYSIRVCERWWSTPSSQIGGHARSWALRAIWCSSACACCARARTKLENESSWAIVSTRCHGGGGGGHWDAVDRRGPQRSPTPRLWPPIAWKRWATFKFKSFEYIDNNTIINLQGYDLHKIWSPLGWPFTGNALQFEANFVRF